MDERAHRLNALAGNEDDRATLEITLTGPTLRFDAAACFALAGADLARSSTARTSPCTDRWSPGLATRWPSAPSRLRARAPGRAWRLCAASGDGQRDHLRSGFGGFQGRALARGDVAAAPWTSGAISRRYRKRCGRSASTCPPRWPASGATPSASCRAAGMSSPTLPRRLHRPGVPHQPAVRSHGLPAAGARAGHGATAPDAVGSGLLRHRAGAIRRRSHHPHGRPADHRRLPKIAQIASVDLPAGASLPGQELRFQQIELDEAQRLDVERERASPSCGTRWRRCARCSDTIDASGRHPSGPGRPL